MLLVPPAVFVDANVLYSRTLRDWICLLALAGDGLSYHLLWSEDVLAEWIYHLRKKNPDLSDAAIGGHRRRLLNAFPHAMVTGYDPATVPATPDPDDRHVLAAATAAAADFLLTAHLADFPTACVQDQFEVISPDDFLNLMTDRNPGLIGQVLAQQLHYFRTRPINPNPACNVTDLCDRLTAAGAPRFAARLRQAPTDEP